jgi:methylphosphotriester-DNA--protein-cysteine methyltransferase
MRMYDDAAAAWAATLQPCTRCSTHSTLRNSYLCHLLECLRSLPIGMNACKIGAVLAAPCRCRDAHALFRQRTHVENVWLTVESGLHSPRSSQ